MALPSKLARVYLGGVNLDDGPVLGIAPVADVGRRKDDMTYKAALRGGPVSHNVLVEGAELLHPPFSPCPTWPGRTHASRSNPGRSAP